MALRVIMRNLPIRGAAASALIKGEESQGYQCIFTTAAGHPYGSNWALEYQLGPNVAGCGFPQKTALKQIIRPCPTCIFWTWHEWISFVNPAWYLEPLLQGSLKSNFKFFNLCHIENFQKADGTESQQTNYSLTEGILVNIDFLCFVLNEMEHF